MLTRLLTLASIIITAVAVTSSFGIQPPPAAEQDPGLHCWLYTGKYHGYRTAEEGCTTLPRTVYWQVDDTTGYPDRITLRWRRELLATRCPDGLGNG